jgi:hypothetical protein
VQSVSGEPCQLQEEQLYGLYPRILHVA